MGWLDVFGSRVCVARGTSSSSKWKTAGALHRQFAGCAIIESLRMRLCGGNCIITARALSDVTFRAITSLLVARPTLPRLFVPEETYRRPCFLCICEFAPRSVGAIMAQTVQSTFKS